MEPDIAAETVTSVAGVGGESWKGSGKKMGFVAKVQRFMNSYKCLCWQVGERKNNKKKEPSG